MSISIEGSRNYSATVIRVPKVGKVPNSDRLRFFNALGIQVIVDDSWEAREGELALIFPAEVQLSHEYTAANGLYRQSLELNENREDAGYLEANRRVRAIKLRGNISNGLVMPMSSLRNYNDYFQVGDVFDTIDGQEICRKYVVPMKVGAAFGHAESRKKKAFKRVDTTCLPEHYDTGQWLREEGSVGADEELIITQKLHGTSVRLANTVVKRQLTKRERFARKFLGAEIAEHTYDLVAGSRKAIKDPNNPNQDHFYGEDIWTDALKVFGDKISKNHIIYGELVGYVPGTIEAIQKGHTYGERGGSYELYVYRVAIITEDAELIDMSWDQVRYYCERHGLKHTPELDRIPKSVFDVEEFNEVNFWAADQAAKVAGKGEEYLPYSDTPVRLSDGGTGKDEGIAIRVERGLTPEIFKFKNKSHYLYESEQLDSGEADLESVG